MDDYEERWQELWTSVVSAFAAEVGHPPWEQLGESEFEVLQRLLQAELGQPRVKKPKRAQPKTKAARSLLATKQRFQTAAIHLWSEADAQDALQEAEVSERSGDTRGCFEHSF